MPALGKQAKTGMAVGLGKGFITTKYEEAPRPSSRKGVRLQPALCFLLLILGSPCVAFATCKAASVFPALGLRAAAVHGVRTGL